MVLCETKRNEMKSVLDIDRCISQGSMAFMPSFGLLELTKRSSAFNDFPQFSWSDKEEIGRVWFRLVWFRFVWFRVIWFRFIWFRLGWFRFVWFRFVSGFRFANYSNPLETEAETSL